jgi:hypothetical protein
MTIKVAAMVLAAVAAMAVPARADEIQTHVLAQASTGKLGREVAYLVCVNPDQVNVSISAQIIHESGALLGLTFPVNFQGRNGANLSGVLGMPAVGNFSVALWMEAEDTLGLTAGTCDVVYYSGTPLREVDRATLTVRTSVKR